MSASLNWQSSNVHEIIVEWYEQAQAEFHKDEV